MYTVQKPQQDWHGAPFCWGQFILIILVPKSPSHTSLFWGISFGLGQVSWTFALWLRLKYVQQCWHKPRYSLQNDHIRMCNGHRAVMAFYCGLGLCPLLAFVLDTLGASDDCSESSTCISSDCDFNWLIREHSNLGTWQLLYMLFQMTRFHWLGGAITMEINDSDIIVIFQNWWIVSQLQYVKSNNLCTFL